MDDLSTAPIEVIARLPSELVPEDRVEELANYRAALRRPPQKSEEQIRLEKETDEARLRQRWLKANLPSDQPPPTKQGPRGGRYTEATTKDGRKYRRYF